MSGTEKNGPSSPNLDWTKFAPDFDLETEKLGTIRCDRVLTIGAFGDISKFLENESLDGTECARELLRCVGKKHDNQNQDESEGALLSDSDVQKVTDQEIEEFARQYVTDNQHFHDSLRQRAESDSEPEGQEESGSADSSSFEILKESGESDSGYLLRVLKLSTERHREQMKLIGRQIKKMLPKIIFSNSNRELYKNQMVAYERLRDIVRSPGVRSAISNMIRLGAVAQRLSNSPGFRSLTSATKRLNAMTEGLRPPLRGVIPRDSISSISENISSVDDSALELSQIYTPISSPQVAVLKTLVENAEKAGEHAEKHYKILAESATFQEIANEILLSIDAAASKTHEDASKKGMVLIRVAVASLVVAVGGIFLTAWLQWQNNEQTVKQNALFQTQIQVVVENQDKKLIDALAAFNAAQEVQSESARQELQELIKVLAEALRAAPDGSEGQ